jgi:hypothetical protein
MLEPSVLVSLLRGVLEVSTSACDEGRLARAVPGLASHGKLDRVAEGLACEALRLASAVVVVRSMVMVSFGPARRQSLEKSGGPAGGGLAGLASILAKDTLRLPPGSALICVRGDEVSPTTLDAFSKAAIRDWVIS